MAFRHLVPGPFCPHACRSTQKFGTFSLAIVGLPLMLLTPGGARAFAADTTLSLVVPEEPRRLRTGFNRAYRVAKWLGRFVYVAPYAQGVIEAMDELRRVYRETRNAAELSQKVDALSKRIDALERQVAGQRAQEEAIAHLRALLKLLADAAKLQPGAGR